MCSQQKERHVLHKAPKHKRIQCGKETREASMAGISKIREEAQDEGRHQMQMHSDWEE